MVIVTETCLKPKGLETRAVAMPTARFLVPKYELLPDEAAINNFFLGCAATSMLSYTPAKLER